MSTEKSNNGNSVAFSRPPRKKVTKEEILKKMKSVEERLEGIRDALRQAQN